jgi:hypothetical protein
MVFAPFFIGAGVVCRFFGGSFLLVLIGKFQLLN